jgi:hypothetical protein
MPLSRLSQLLFVAIPWRSGLWGSPSRAAHLPPAADMGFTATSC